MIANMRWMMVSGLALALGAGCGSSVQTGTGGGGSGGGTNLCAGFADQQGTASVKVRFKNNTIQPIYLPSQCTLLSYSIDPVSGDDGVNYVFGGGCLQTCEALQTQGPIFCGACPEETYRIDPGQSRETTWDGTGLQGGFVMPAACWAPGNSTANGCSKVVAAAAGEYRVTVAGFAECSGDCTCTADGVCNGSPSGLQALPNPAKVNFPTETSVDVVFDTCAFGCP